MLDYERQIFLDILQEDGVVIAAKGVGLDSVVISLMKIYCDAGNLVFVLGTEGNHQKWLLDKLKRTQVNPQPKVISAEVGVAEREQSYMEGGLWFVPPRILVVDLIKKRIPVDLITGFIVCKAHNILKNHQDAFVLRLFRQANKAGFIKAFSDQAASFKGGFNTVEQILKALFVRKLFLWPRYHAGIKTSLSICKPTVIELQLEMTSKMLQLQNAFLDLIKVTVQELKRLNPTLDTEEVTVENAISDSFHKVLHSQLDPVWHALSERTKALLADLKLFHYMVVSLLTLDSISFYALVNSQRKSDCALRGSGWHLLPSAEVIFTTAKSRVFKTVEADPADADSVDAEPNPKWMVLSEVLGEILSEYEGDVMSMPKFKQNNKDEVEKKLENLFGTENSRSKEEVCLEENEIDVLILTRDERNCSQIQTLLTLGSKELLAMQYRKHFCHQLPAKKSDDNDGESPQNVVEEGGKAEEEKEDLERDTYILSLSSENFTHLVSSQKSGIAGYFEDSFALTQKNDLLYEQLKATQSEVPCIREKPPPMVVIKSYRKNLLSIPQILEDNKPRWVVIYDAEMTLVRQLEVYQRRNPDIPLKVYFLVFGGTIEEQAYLTSLRKEKEAFDYLIGEKARIVIPEDINDFPELCRDDPATLELLSRTRKGGLESPSKDGQKIIVDMREFRSELPALIHARGIEIEPLTITIGDYILTPDICLERKSVSDLIQSLNSGRLYNQAMALTRHYSKPMLLIEFDKNKPFDLQDRYYLSTDASSDQLVTKLQLLTLHFPKLRLIWSPSPNATAQLFEELKQGQPQPDSATALGLGVEQDATDEDKFNPGIQKFLSYLPGVTNKNIYSILLKGKSLDHLQTLSKEEISGMVQNSVEGENLFNSIHKIYRPDESSSSITSNKNRMKPGLGRGKRKRFH